MAQADHVTNSIRALITRASANPSTIRAAHVELVATLAGHPPRPIPVYADAIDLEDRAEHLEKVLKALSAYLTTILDDTAQNVPGGLDLRQVDAVLCDLVSEVSGTVHQAGERLAGRTA
jgi:peptide subunit release factor 1 (eRF1)